MQPIERPILTDFCRSLTHIDQASIDTAAFWPSIANELSEFSKQYNGGAWGSWGAYDRRQIERECTRHSIENPLAGIPHLNLKATFAKTRKIKQVGMATALKITGLNLIGDHHRALSDARNIVQLLPWSIK